MKMSKKPKIKGGFSGSEPGQILESISLGFLEKPIRFSFRDCDTDDYCIRTLDRREIRRLYDRFKSFEQLSWQQVRQRGHEYGFSIESKDGRNHQDLSAIFSTYSTFMHFRVNGTQSPFRVFAAQDNDLCCILRIDKQGTMNH